MNNEITKSQDAITSTNAATLENAEKTQMTFVPNADIYEIDNVWKIVLDMPGVDEKSLDIGLEDGILKIVGKTEEQTTQENYKIMHSEYYTGNYERSFQISDKVDVEKIQAKINHGVLTLTLPKVEKAKPKKIQVQSA